MPSVIFLRIFIVYFLFLISSPALRFAKLSARFREDMPKRDNPHRGEGTFNCPRSPPAVPQRCKLPTVGNRTPTPARAAPSGSLGGKSPSRESEICFIFKSKSTEAEPERGSNLPFQWKSRLWTRAKLSHFCNFI